MLRPVVLVIALQCLAGTLARGGEELFQPAGIRNIERDGNRFYLAGIMGASFATVTATESPSATSSLFTAGGAAGVAFEMLDRSWRLEVEGRARDPVSGTAVIDDAFSTSTLTGSGGWSTTVNLWRDFDVTRRLNAYVGGGIGGGGYQFSVNQQYPVQDVTVTGAGTINGFAWQAGGGLAYALTERVTLDLGYRFFDLASGNVTAQVAQSGLLYDTTSFSSAFSASELFFAIRIHEPFRRWR